MIPSVDVYLSAGDDGLDVLVGRARFNLRRSRISTAFAYDEKYGAAEVDGLRALAPICGLSEREAARLVSRVLRALDGWKTEAIRLGCPRSEVELFAPVFADRCEGLVAAFR